MQTSPTEFDGNELDWLAFRYVAGELEEAEVAQFEERLAVDQVAREAVARSVEVTGVLSAALSQSEVKPIPAARQPAATLRVGTAIGQSLKRSRWGLLTSAAALAILAAGLVWQRTQQLDVVSSAESLTNAEQLVALWSEDDSAAAKVEGSPVAPPAGVAEEHPANVNDDRELVADVTVDDLLPKLPPNGKSTQPGEENDDVPEWMLAGVSLEFNADLQTPEKGVR